MSIRRRPRRATANWRASLLAALATTTGCFTVGSEFPTKPVAEIRMGETTREDIERLFGSPWRVGIEDGQRTWTYGRYRYSVFGASSTRDLVVRFDAAGVVSSYAFNSTDPEDL